jgi:hypothetical protein
MCKYLINNRKEYLAKMIEKRKLIILAGLMFLMYCLPVPGTFAQDVISATGGNASGSGGSVNYTIGQIVYYTHNGQGGLVSEGIQKPYEISVVTSVEETLGINLTIAAFPNPTTDYLTLQVDEIAMPDIFYYLFDLQGKHIQSERISANHTSIFMGDLIPAIYFVRVIQGNREIKTFKIMKR